MQKLQKENWTLEEKTPNCAIWQPVPRVLRAVRALDEPRWVSVLRAACRRSLLSRQRATGGSLFAERIQQNYLQRSDSTVNVCVCLSGGCPAPAPSRPQPHHGSPQPVPLSPAPTAGFQPRNPRQPASHHSSPAGETRTQTQSCLWKNSNCALRLCFKERTRRVKKRAKNNQDGIALFSQRSVS